MKISYDQQIDALYISFKQGPTELTSIRLSEYASVHLGPK